MQLEQSLFGLEQGMGNGVIRAEEFNQITDPMPGLLQKNWKKQQDWPVVACAKWWTMAKSPAKCLSSI